MTGHHREPFWYALTGSHQRELQRLGTIRGYAPEQVIVREQEQTNFAIVLFEGCVKVSASGIHGYQAILGLRNPGDLVGEQAAVDGGTRSATLTALTQAEALILPAVSFRAYLRAHPDAAAILHRTVSTRLREADRYRIAAGSEPVPQRMAALMLLLSDRYGLPDEETGGRRIDLPLSQEDLAGLVLTSQRTLARILELWRTGGLIRTGRRTILLLDVVALRAIAGDQMSR